VDPVKLLWLKSPMALLQADPLHKREFGAPASLYARCLPLFRLTGRGGEGVDVGGSERKVWPERFGEFRSLPCQRNFPCCSDTLCPTSPTRGRSVVLEFPSFIIDGAHKDSCVGVCRRLEGTSASIIYAAICRVSKPVSSGTFSTSIGGPISGQRPRPMSTLKQVVSSPRWCSTAVQLAHGSAEELGRGLFASQIFQRGLLHTKGGPMFFSLFLMGSSAILYTSSVYG